MYKVCICCGSPDHKNMVCPKRLEDKRFKKRMEYLPSTARQKQEILKNSGIFVTSENINKIRIQLNETTKTLVAKTIGAKILKERGREFGTEVPVKAKNGKMREIDLYDFTSEIGYEFCNSKSVEMSKELLEIDVNICIIETDKLSENLNEMEARLKKMIV